MSPLSRPTRSAIKPAIKTNVSDVWLNTVQRISNGCHSGYFREMIAFEFLTVVVEVI